MRSARIISSGAALIVASLLIAASTPTLVAAAPDTHSLGGPGVIHYTEPGDGPIIVIQGTHFSRGCLFRVTGTEPQHAASTRHLYVVYSVVQGRGLFTTRLV